ncbi:MAG: hypothetical protein WC027_00515 [Candidatus Paceibacterota bacterium]
MVIIGALIGLALLVPVVIEAYDKKGEIQIGMNQEFLPGKKK